MNKHWRRLWKSILGQWKPEGRDDTGDADWGDKQPGRKSDYKGYWGELGHSAKNIAVEWVRKTGIYDRPSQPDGRE